MLICRVKKFQMMLAVLALVGGTLACNLPGASSSPSPVPASPTTAEMPIQPTAPKALPPTETAAPEPTMLPPTAVPPTPTTPPIPDVVFNGVSFSFDKTLAKNVKAEIVPAVPASDDIPPWEVGPEYFNFTFENYILKDSYHQAEILIYSTAEYASVLPEGGNTIEELKEILKNKPTQVESLPFIPMWNAAQMLQANIKYMSFPSLNGVRFLTQYGQDVSPINNYSVFYTFQGITTDGKYYVSAIFPVNHPALPATYDSYSTQQMEALMKDYPAYLNSVEKQLGAQTDASFTPNLALLDALVESIQINK